MFHKPKTLEQAKEYKYGTWAGSPNGSKYKEGKCVAEVWPSSGWSAYQCSRKNGHGPEGLYCKQHAYKL